MNTRVWWMILTLIAGVAAGCGQRSAENNPGRPASSPAQQGGAPDQSRRITIVGTDDAYAPATVEINAGREYDFVFKNEGTNVHNLVIQAKDRVGQDFTSSIVVNANEESAFKVKIDQEGTYAMQCTYHQEIKGEVKVTR